MAATIGSERGDASLAPTEGDRLLGRSAALESPTWGPVGWLKNLKRQFGWRILLLVFVFQHCLNGFARNLVGPAGTLPYLFRYYAIPAPTVLVNTAVLHSIWVTAPVIALCTDSFPIMGYFESPYIIFASLLGTFGCCIIFAIPDLPSTFLLLCLVFLQLQQVTTNVYCNGAIVKKVQRNEGYGANLQTFVSFGIEAAGLAGNVLTGVVVAEFNPRISWAIAAIPAAAVLWLTISGFVEDADPPQNRNARERRKLWRRRELHLLATFLFASAVFTNSLTLGRASLHAIVAGYVTMALCAMICFGAFLGPTLAQVSIFSIVYNALCFNIDSALFYFLTDSSQALPGGPNVSALFYNSVRGPVYGGFALVGIFTYNRYMSQWSYRRTILFSNASLAASTMLTLIIVTRTNLRLGIPDTALVLVHAALRSMTQQWTRMPLRVLFMFLCPCGMEATMYALLKGTSDLGGAVGDSLGAWLLDSLGCRPTGVDGESANFQNLPFAIVLASVALVVGASMLLPLIPDATVNTQLVTEEAQAFAGSFWQTYSGQSSQDAKAEFDTYPITLGKSTVMAPAACMLECGTKS